MLPAGLRGFVVAWFFAEFVASLSGSVNWGASLLVNDLYRRFVRKEETDGHYLRAGRAASALILAGATAAALAGETLLDTFKNILHLTAGVGVVQIAQWLWWRTNAASEIAAMIVSPLCVLAAGPAAGALGIPPESDLFRLLFVIIVSAAVCVPATFLSNPVGRLQLRQFYFRVAPPGRRWRQLTRGMTPPVRPFLLSSAPAGWAWLAVSLVAALALTRTMWRG